MIKEKSMNNPPLQEQVLAKLKAAKRVSRDYNIKYKDISFVKEWEEWTIFAFDLDEREEHKALLVRDVYPQYLFCPLHSYRSGDEVFHFTEEEIDVWRYRFLKALLEIVKRSDALEAGLSKEWAVRQIVDTTAEHLVEIMPYNTPKGYAEIISNDNNNI